MYCLLYNPWWFRSPSSSSGLSVNMAAPVNPLLHSVNREADSAPHVLQPALLLPPTHTHTTGTPSHPLAYLESNGEGCAALSMAVVWLSP